MRNGLLGWKSLLDLPEPIRAAIDSLPKGAVSGVISSDKELSIYRLEERANERILTLEDDWQLLADKAKDIQAQKKLIELVNRWRKQVYISIRI